MTLVAIVLLLVVGGGVALALWLRRAAQRADEAFADRIRRHGLEQFNRRLRDDVGRRLRPMDHLAVTRMMVEVLEQLDLAAPQSGQAAVVAPPDESYRLACEELVALQKLVRTPGGVYARAGRSSR